MTVLAPGWHKGHWRLGKALCDLSRWKEMCCMRCGDRRCGDRRCHSLVAGVTCSLWCGSILTPSLAHRWSDALDCFARSWSLCEPGGWRLGSSWGNRRQVGVGSGSEGLAKHTVAHLASPLLLLLLLLAQAALSSRSVSSSCCQPCKSLHGKSWLIDCWRQFNLLLLLTTQRTLCSILRRSS